MEAFLEACMNIKNEKEKQTKNKQKTGRIIKDYDRDPGSGIVV